ncbi:hypothetical protein FRX31_005568 [Thalictrum thalictroides]|uniref:RNase H type-1 domain-containing protein n=1 Tax=Thalictrum thalictroides TaxID=46969 RepID=A0A7J6X7L3_THATH|nr:hypothetical protein FRX31_005568 [Thalictrum thalictroides]
MAIKLEEIEQGLEMSLRNNCAVYMHKLTLLMVAFLPGSNNSPWLLRHMVTRIRKMIGKFKEFTLKHIYRETNQLVDSLH